MPLCARNSSAVHIIGTHKRREREKHYILLSLKCRIQQTSKMAKHARESY